MNKIDPTLFKPLQKSTEATALPKGFQLSLWQSFQKNRLAHIGFLILSTIFFLALLVPYFSSIPHDAIYLSQKNLPPSNLHWFGTDELGRDLFIRCWHGTRLSLFVGITAGLIDLIIGVFWGGIAATSGGKVDEIMMRITDALHALPYLMIVILLMVLIGNGVVPIIIALACTGWINMARIVRSQMLQLKTQNYVLAAQVLGASRWHLLCYHLIPNSLGNILVTVTLTIPSAIFTESVLSFLGLGIQAPMTSLGTMINEGLPALRYYPWRLLFPILFMIISLFSFNVIGDGLRDAFHSNLKRQL